MNDCIDLENDQHIRDMQKQLNAKLRFINLTQSASPMVVEMDCELKLTYIDAAVETFFGYTLEEVRGEPVLQYFHPQDRDRMERYGKALFTGGTASPREYRAVKRDGSIYAVLISQVPLYSGDTPAGIRVFILDIAENSRAEKRILSTDREISELHSNIEEHSFGDIISRDPVMLAIFDTVRTVASVPTSVLITGENGCGKELIAHQLHSAGIRRNEPFVVVNSGALPENLLEAELFGHKAGAFTDAKHSRTGKFQLAHGGTLFLDEIGDMPLSVQVKLLRALQERVITPLGSNEEIAVDVRLLAATNRDLESMVEAGTFREDLYYRIKVVKIEMPPLRQRRCDIPLLSNFFTRHYSDLFGKEVAGIYRQVLDFLIEYTYPGNIRELKNIIEHAVVFCEEGCSIDFNHLPQDLFIDTEKSAPQSEKQEIIDAIRAAGNKTQAARKLGMHKTTLFRKIKKYGISDDMILQ